MSAVNPACVCIRKPPHMAWRQGYYTLRKKITASREVSHSCVWDSRTSAICSVSIGLRWQRKGSGSRGKKTTRVMNQLLREEIRELDMLVKESTCLILLILWRNESRSFLREKLLVMCVGGKQMQSGCWVNQTTLIQISWAPSPCICSVDSPSRR